MTERVHLITDEYVDRICEDIDEGYFPGDLSDEERDACVWSAIGSMLGYHETLNKKRAELGLAPIPLPEDAYQFSGKVWRRRQHKAGATHAA